MFLGFPKSLIYTEWNLVYNHIWEAHFKVGRDHKGRQTQMAFLYIKEVSHRELKWLVPGGKIIVTVATIKIEFCVAHSQSKWVFYYPKGLCILSSSYTKRQEDFKVTLWYL